MTRLFALAVLVLAPLAVVTTGPLRAEGEPAGAATEPTTSATGTGATGTGTDSDTGTDSATNGDTSTMPPKYEPCGCRNVGEGGAWAALALLFTAGSPSRRRRRTR